MPGMTQCEMENLTVESITMPTGRQINNQKRRRDHRVERDKRRFIAWDGEGMKLSGDSKPQHYVLYGCSVEIESPLIDRKGLDFFTLADYMLEIAARYPKSYHVGYYFKYDQNMIIKSLPWRLKVKLYETGEVYVSGHECRYHVKIVFGKTIRITRYREDRSKSTILIEDFAAFFASSFVVAYEKTFPDAAKDPSFKKIVEGKRLRADTRWQDLPAVLEYWQHEIKALQRLAEAFRDLMYGAGFYLTSWYGPGALANYIRRENKLIEHEWGGKESNMPAAVRAAAKSAMYGGHFEQYQFGRITGRIVGMDINNAYPYAFTFVPTLREGGFWQQVDISRITNAGMIKDFAMYKIRFDDCMDNGLPDPVYRWPGPLPHRNERWEITYPQRTEGWYWGPEVRVMTAHFPGAKWQMFDGWEWIPADDSFPWKPVIESMYAKRLELKRAGDPAQMAFKLGPNSLYGKMAQRVGWNKKTGAPPRSHTLPIAGFITSFCRAMIWQQAMACDFTDLIAIETDGVYFSVRKNAIVPPSDTVLGGWTFSIYDEMLFIQNGLYMARQGKEWTTLKTRGIDRETFLDRKGKISDTVLSNYLASCGSDGDWKELQLSAGERFTGIGAAIARSRTTPDNFNPFKASALHCRWTADIRGISVNSSSKRVHHAGGCLACCNGLSANETGHNLIVNLRAIACPVESVPYPLPWEKFYKVPDWIVQSEQESDTFAR